MAIKVGRHSKNQRPFISSYLGPSPQTKYLYLPKAKAISKNSKGRDKGKGVFQEFPKKLGGKKCSKCYGYNHFQADYPNRRELIMKEIEEIDQTNLDSSEEEGEREEEVIVLPHDVGEFLVLKRILPVMEGSKEESQRDHIFHSRCTV